MVPGRGHVIAALVDKDPRARKRETARADAQIVLITHRRPIVKPGDKIGLAVDEAMVHVFDKERGERLAA